MMMMNRGDPPFQFYENEQGIKKVKELHVIFFIFVFVLYIYIYIINEIKWNENGKKLN